MMAIQSPFKSNAGVLPLQGLDETLPSSPYSDPHHLPNTAMTLEYSMRFITF